MVALTGFFVWGVVMSEESNVETDDITLCPTEQPPNELVALLIDVSDTPSSIQRIAIENEITRVIDKLPTLARLEIFSLSALPGKVLESELVICNPGDGNELSSIYQNPAMARRRWEEDFWGQLRPIIDGELDAPESLQSPIFEGIQSIAVATFGRPQYDGVPKRLVIVSDMLQYVPGAESHYRSVTSIEELRNSAYFNRVRTDLRGLDAEIIYIQRAESTVQGVEHIRFWEGYFDVQGARLIEVRRVFG